MIQISNVAVDICNIGRVAFDFFRQIGNIGYVLIRFLIQHFQLRHVDRIGVFRTCGEICNLTGHCAPSAASGTHRNSAQARLPCHIVGLAVTQVSYLACRYISAAIGSDSDGRLRVCLRILADRHCAAGIFYTGAITNSNPWNDFLTLVDPPMATPLLEESVT